MAISMAIHEIIITFFSLLAVNLSEKTAPAKKKNSKKLINELKPTKNIIFFSANSVQRSTNQKKSLLQ